MTLRTPILLGCLISVTMASGFALATELTPDGSDPNGPPPPPPPLTWPGSPPAPTAAPAPYPPPAPAPYPAPAPTGTVPPPPPPGSGMQPNAPVEGSTAQRLDQSTQLDNGIGFHLAYLQPEIGVGWASLGDTLPSSAPYGDRKEGLGPLFGVGAGLELVTLQIGARFRGLPTDHFSLWSVGGEFNYQPGAGRFWPRVGVFAGYAWASNWCATSCAGAGISGFQLGGRAGIEYFLVDHFAIGADLTADVLFLNRTAGRADPQLMSGGSGTGVQLGGLVHLGIHLP